MALPFSRVCQSCGRPKGTRSVHCRSCTRATARWRSDTEQPLARYPDVLSLDELFYGEEPDESEQEDEADRA